MKVRTLEQGKTIEELENAVNKLAKSKHKTSAELHDLKNELEMTENEAKAKKARSSQTVQQLNSELQTTKQALEESRVREKQVNTVLFRTCLLFCFGGCFFLGGGGGWRVTTCPRKVQKLTTTDVLKKQTYSISSRLSEITFSFWLPYLSLNGSAENWLVHRLVFFFLFSSRLAS